MYRRFLLLLLLSATAVSAQSVAQAHTRHHSHHAQHHKARHAKQLVSQAGPVPRGLKSNAVLVIDQETGATVYGKNTTWQTPIASITKLMNAMVNLDAKLPMDEPITITAADEDHLRHTGSRLRVGTTMTRGELMQLALMASENRAAAALARTYPGGTSACVAAMNRKAKELHMLDSRFADGTGLNSHNVSTAEDLARMVNAAYHYDRIRKITTTAEYHVAQGRRGGLDYRNTNLLVRESHWDIGLSKTGFINEAGHCLVMQMRLNQHPYIIVLLDSWGKYSRIADAERIKQWLEARKS